MTQVQAPPMDWREAIAVKQTSSHTYEAHFREDWVIGSVPHGGYVTGIFLEVVKTHFRTTLASQNQPHTITLHLEFLRRTQTGPATFVVKDVKLGRQISNLHVTLQQDGQDEVVGYIANSNMDTEKGINIPTLWKLHPAPPSVNLELLKKGEDPNWEQTIMRFSDFRKALKKMYFYLPRKQAAEVFVDQWVRFKNGDRWTNESLGYISDAWLHPMEKAINGNDEIFGKRSSDPSMPFSARFWYPTLLLNLDVKKALPEEGVEWLFVRVSVKEIKNGRFDIEVTIFDEGGDLVALSHHAALALDASRNLKRSNKSKI